MAAFLGSAKTFCVKVISGHVPSWGLLVSLQPVAWAVVKGYVT